MDIPLENNFLHLLPVSFYCKNVKGVYLNGNNYFKNKMQSTGIKIHSLIGRSDYSVFSKSIADYIRSNDIEAMENKKSIVKYEKIILTKNKKLKETIFLSVKKPIFNTDNRICGIIGISIDVTDYHESLAATMPTKNLLSLFENNSIGLKKTLQLSGKWHKVNLTFRQAQCAYLLCLGKTNNEIAAFLGLSVRTIEDHILQLKIKFNSIKRSRLIEILFTEVGVSTIFNFVTQRSS